MNNLLFSVLSSESVSLMACYAVNGAAVCEGNRG